MLAYSGKRYDEGISVIELPMQTLKRLLLTISMCCLMATANADPLDDADAAYKRGDYAQALKILKPLAAQGVAEAQLNLGNMYYNGKGVTQYYISAHMWWNLASSAGDADGAKNRDIVAKKMTPQQIEKAQDMARECQARNFKGC